MYWILLILTLIPTPNIPIYKFKHQSMFDNYADLHIGTAVKVLRSFMHNSKVCRISKEALMHNFKYAGYQKRPHVKFHCICHSIVKLLYTGKGKKRTWDWRTRCALLYTTTINIELYVCIFYCLFLWPVNAYFIWTVIIDICCNCMNICEHW